MKVTARYTIASLMSLLLVEAALGQRLYPSEQREFSAEESGPKKPVAIPRVVLMALANDKTVRHILESEGIPEEKLPLSWFSASEIHLSLSDRPDLIVFGEPPISGGNSMMIWIFHARGDGFQLVLTTAAHGLGIENTRSKGCRDITATAETASTISTLRYRFDGQSYAPYKSKTEVIR